MQENIYIWVALNGSKAKILEYFLPLTWENFVLNTEWLQSLWLFTVGDVTGFENLEC